MNIREVCCRPEVFLFLFYKFEPVIYIWYRFLVNETAGVRQLDSVCDDGYVEPSRNSVQILK